MGRGSSRPNGVPRVHLLEIFLLGGATAGAGTRRLLLVGHHTRKCLNQKVDKRGDACFKSQHGLRSPYRQGLVGLRGKLQEVGEEISPDSSQHVLALRGDEFVQALSDRAHQCQNPACEL